MSEAQPLILRSLYFGCVDHSTSLTLDKWEFLCQFTVGYTCVNRKATQWRGGCGQVILDATLHSMHE